MTSVLFTLGRSSLLEATFLMLLGVLTALLAYVIHAVPIAINQLSASAQAASPSPSPSPSPNPNPNPNPDPDPDPNPNPNPIPNQAAAREWCAPYGHTAARLAAYLAYLGISLLCGALALAVTLPG